MRTCVQLVHRQRTLAADIQPAIANIAEAPPDAFGCLVPGFTVLEDSSRTPPSFDAWAIRPGQVKPIGPDLVQRIIRSRAWLLCRLAIMADSRCWPRASPSSSSTKLLRKAAKAHDAGPAQRLNQAKLRARFSRGGLDGEQQDGPGDGRQRLPGPGEVDLDTSRAWVILPFAPRLPCCSQYSASLVATFPPARSSAVLAVCWPLAYRRFASCQRKAFHPSSLDAGGLEVDSISSPRKRVRYGPAAPFVRLGMVRAEFIIAFGDAAGGRRRVSMSANYKPGHNGSLGLAARANAGTGAAARHRRTLTARAREYRSHRRQRNRRTGAIYRRLPR